MNELELVDVSYRYRKDKALDGINLSIPEGALLGIIGPNGSGKTTLLSVLAGILPPTEGTLIKPDHLKIGGLIENPAFYPHLTVLQQLRLIACLRSLPNPDCSLLIDMVGLTPQAHTRCSHLSLGMKQRLGIACALVGDNDLIILDEPTNSVDPPGVGEIRTLIRQLWEQGKTIVFSSHLLAEIDQLCTHIAILNAGILRFFGSRCDLIGQEASLEEAFIKKIS